MDVKKIAVISLGCDKNRVDTEKMLAYLARGSYQLTSEQDAQIVIVNTCAFIESARKEAIDTILEAAALKAGNCEKLIVTGCLPQKYLSELKDGLPEVDAFLGVNAYSSINEVIENLYIKESDAPCVNSLQNTVSTVLKPCMDDINFTGRVLTTPRLYAYLKVADGCCNHCTYCTIPGIRGAYRSQSIESLATEAQRLADEGVKELILVAQDVTNYGFDLYGERRLVPLIKKLSQTGVEWIRLMYCYPALIDDSLIAEIRDNAKVVKYLDMPIQHSDNRILKLMGRRDTTQSLTALISKLRENISGIALRTTFMTGFPSETESEFENLSAFAAQTRFTHAGIFCYSAEEDTPSAKITGRVTKRDALRRKRELARIQAENVADFNKQAIGQIFKVLYEGIDFGKKMFYGRAYFSAPEIDTLIYFKADTAYAGEFYDVRITGAKGYDLIGEKI